MSTAPRCPILPALALLLGACGGRTQAAAKQEPGPNPLPPEAQLVAFPGPDGELLKGFLYIPPGKGPFPAVLFNHGSEKLPGWKPELARFYNQHGFVFFVPHRRGHGQSPGPYIVDRIAAIQADVKDRAERERRFVALQEEASRDVDAALAALHRIPEVDGSRIVMSGCSFGGIQTLLAAEKGQGVRAFVAFAPGAMSWRPVPALGERLRRAVRITKAPVLVVQAENDYDLAPSRVLGEELRRRADGSGSKVYPAFGKSAEEGHSLCAGTPAATTIWGADVLAFLQKAGVPGSPSR